MHHDLPPDHTPHCEEDPPLPICLTYCLHPQTQEQHQLSQPRPDDVPF